MKNEGFRENIDLDENNANLKREYLKAHDLIQQGQAHRIEERDQNNNLKSVSIFKNDGTLIFYQDSEGLEKYNEIFKKEN